MSAKEITEAEARAKSKKRNKNAHVEDRNAVLVKDGAALKSKEHRKDDQVIDDASPPQSEKKRKRQIDPVEELEIDVNLPEPLSKREQRKAKKVKSKPEDDGSTATGAKSNEDRDAAEDVSKGRSQWGIWIGNLPWTATKNDLRKFVTDGAQVSDESITRLHMPTPNFIKTAEKGPVINHNKGYAYVDFDTESTLKKVMKLTETPFSQAGRKVLIKNATSFAGRPENHGSKTDGAGLSSSQANSSKPPSKRIFVGNLAFETDKDDLAQHYSKCGSVADVHMATFEDSGKCKGFAWVIFEEIEAAEQAVRGWVWVENDKKKSPESDEEDDDNDGAEAPRKKKGLNRRRWFVNKFMGRALRTEFAEDAGVRYKKRFGKDGSANRGNANAEPILGASNNQEASGQSESTNSRYPARVRRQQPVPQKLVGDINLNKVSGAVVASEGTKTTFDD